MDKFIKQYTIYIKKNIEIDLLHDLSINKEFLEFDIIEQDDIIYKLSDIYDKLKKEVSKKSKTKTKPKNNLAKNEEKETEKQDINTNQESSLQRLLLEEKFDKIKAIILPEQRSPEWFAMRNNKITASDAGMVLGLNKYEAQYQFVLNKVFGKEFISNEFCYHGKKFEQVVTMYYEYNYDVIVDEFGLLGHSKYDFLGASPDGIVSKYKRDGVTPTHLLGRMLEIKCPFRRKICYTGDIKGDICPIYYWCQVQLQLECCDLDECDFVQCVIEEYDTRKEFIEDTVEQFKSNETKLPKGIVIELVPKNLPEITNDIIYDKTSFLYPPKIDMNIEELNNWVLEKLDNIPKDKILHRVIYWRFKEIACHLIKRDKEWFYESLGTFRKMWDYVEMCRNNNKIALELKSYIDSLSTKYNKTVMNKLQDLYDRYTGIKIS